MARLRRIQLAGIPVHAVVRGNNRMAIFRGEGDRIFFHRCLVETMRRRGVAIHAYVMMGNHAHFLATPLETGALGAAMQSLGRRYVGYFNYMYQRTGTLWEGRYRSSPIEEERSFLLCQRYIEQNPVRAGMVGAAADFAWSSHRAHMGRARDDLVTPHDLFRELGLDDRSRREAYADLFRTLITGTDLEMIRDCLNHGWALGQSSWRTHLEEQAGRRVERAKRGRPKKVRDAKVESDPVYGQATARIWEPG